jgi:EthD domain
MEKLVCALWKPDGEARDKFNARLLASLPAALHAAGASRVRINLRDAAVDPAAGLIQQWQTPQQDAVAQFWLPSANARFRAATDAALAEHSARFALWLVAESTVIANSMSPSLPGERSQGWSQASFISFRQDRSRQECLVHWRGHHTGIAIDTQANFEYVQNLIVEPLSEFAPGYDAFVEECFPSEAMTDPSAFFAAEGEPDRLKANLDAMMASCGAFIDFTRIDIIPTSKFDFAQSDPGRPA